MVKILEFEYELKLQIFKFVDYPLNLALTCRSWLNIAKDPYAKTEWLIIHYGKAHSIYNALRLGPKFYRDISDISEKVKISRIFVQMLLINLGKSSLYLNPMLIKLWKQIEYYKICDDVNDLVMRGALLILFPPTPSSDWTCPSKNTVISRLVELRNLGFKLKDNVVDDALHMFEHRLDEIGAILLDAFLEIRSDE